jgi:uncharacterized damage-inducible protein DinB
MSVAIELAGLFRRDIARLVQEVRAFPEEAFLWETRPGVANSAGNLALHLEGNLRDFIGRQLGGVEYTRQRELEFSHKGVPRETLAVRLEEVQELVYGTVAALTAGQFEEIYPINVLGVELTTRQFLMHLYGHLSFHLGQMDYLRRVITGDGALKFVRL